MLFVEVEVPMLGQVYDFKVDKREKVEKVLCDMVTKICQKERCVLCGEEDKLLLWNNDFKEILPRDRTMEECGIKTGIRLLLV